jgi:hypothetical protein
MPTRFLSSRQWQEALITGRPVRETPIKRFDRKEDMERDLERYCAEARERLRRNGFDIPPFLMPKPKITDEDKEAGKSQDIDDLSIDYIDALEFRMPAMIGPKPTPLVSDKEIAEAVAKQAENAQKLKEKQHVHGQDNVSGTDALPDMAGAVLGPAMDEAGHARAQAEAIAREKSAYEGYVKSLNGGAGLLDHAGQNTGGEPASRANEIEGRVDDFKQAETRKSRIDLPDNTANWAAQDEMARKRKAALAKQDRERAKSERARQKQRQPMSWNAFLARAAAYMIAAVAIGYVLVLTFNEFSAIVGK